MNYSELQARCLEMFNCTEPARTRLLHAVLTHTRLRYPQITGLGTAKDAGIAIFGFLAGVSFDLFPAWCAGPPPLCRASEIHSRTFNERFIASPSRRYAIMFSVTADISGFLLIWGLYTQQFTAPYPVVWCIFVLAYGCNAGFALGPLKYTLGNFPEFRGMAAGFLKPMDGLCAAIYTQVQTPTCRLSRDKSPPRPSTSHAKPFLLITGCISNLHGKSSRGPSPTCPCPPMSLLPPRLSAAVALGARSVHQRLPPPPGSFKALRVTSLPAELVCLRKCLCGLAFNFPLGARRLKALLALYGAGGASCHRRPRDAALHDHI